LVEMAGMDRCRLSETGWTRDRTEVAAFMC
jgi:hypothetical protein